MPDIAIRVENLSKKYQLGTIGYGSLRHDLSARWARARGKEDPHAHIGEKSRLDLHGDFWALKDVSFEVKQGDRLGLIGHNGAGKSTLLKILSRVTAPTEGRVFLKGRVVSLLEVGTGFHPELTGRENVFLNGAILGMKRRQILSKFDEILDFAGIEQFIDTPVKRYSSGMYVRLAFAVAAHLDGEILIADEVLAVGDLAFQKKCIGKMHEVNSSEGRTIVFVSHNLDSVKNVCNRGVLLSKGAVATAGNIESVIQQYIESHKSSDDAIDIRAMARDQSSAPVQIDSLEVVGNNAAGDRIRLRIKFEVKMDVPQLWFGINFTCPNGEVACSVTSLDNGTFEKCRPGSYECQVETDNLLLPGNYFISLAIADRNQTIYHAGRVCTFEVQTKNETDRIEDSWYKRHGYVDFKSSWKITRK